LTTESAEEIVLRAEVADEQTKAFNMGLDLLVEGSAKPGHEAEWRDLLARSFEGRATEGDAARFQVISIPPYQRIGAPRVGFDAAADEWMIKARGAKTEEQATAALQENRGYYVLRLVQCDGIPQYSHGGLYEGVDETSFRGSFLSSCGDVLSAELMHEAWNSKLPEAAISYGRALLAAADTAAVEEKSITRRLLSRLGSGREKTPFADQLDIVRAAGRWYIFWGERGHPIRAWS
jgi:hypothetical protein